MPGPLEDRDASRDVIWVKARGSGVALIRAVGFFEAVGEARSPVAFEGWRSLGQPEELCPPVALEGWRSLGQPEAGADSVGWTPTRSSL